jgi:hypothetical protein
LGMLTWALILEIQYSSPYKIIQMSNREKWRKAATLAFLQTAMIPVLGLAQPTLSPHSDQWPIFPMFCGGIWLVIFPTVVLFKKWEFERRIKSYQRMDKAIKDKKSVYHSIFSKPFTGWIRIFMTAEQRRFFKEGFPDNIENQNGDEHSSHG